MKTTVYLVFFDLGILWANPLPAAPSLPLFPTRINGSWHQSWNIHRLTVLEGGGGGGGLSFYKLCCLPDVFKQRLHVWVVSPAVPQSLCKLHFWTGRAPKKKPQIVFIKLWPRLKGKCGTLFSENVEHFNSKYVADSSRTCGTLNYQMWHHALIRLCKIFYQQTLKGYVTNKITRWGTFFNGDICQNLVRGCRTINEVLACCWSSWYLSMSSSAAMVPQLSWYLTEPAVEHLASTCLPSQNVPVSGWPSYLWDTSCQSPLLLIAALS